MDDPVPKIILCVPGPWSTYREVVEAVSKGGEFLVTDGALQHLASGRTVALELYKSDPRMERAFYASSAGRFPPADLQAIAAHSMVAYVVGSGGSYENAGFMVKAGAALIQAGGLGVKIESSGLAHTSDAWLDFVDKEMSIYALNAYVTYVAAQDSLYSCGMHNLGFRDAIFHNPPQDALEQLRLFLLYILTPEKPLSDNNTVTLGEIKYRLRTTPCTTQPADHPFHNPYGMWSIEAL